MSILDQHLTDQELSAFGQSNMDELAQKARMTGKITVVVRSFFLNPAALGAAEDDIPGIEKGIAAKLGEMLTPGLFPTLMGSVARTFRGLGDLAYKSGDNELQVVLSRPDDQLTLKHRITARTRIKEEDLDVSADLSVHGFDNLEILGRVYQVFNSIPNGGAARLKALGAFGLIQYRSMIGARRGFMERGGDAKITELHAAASHVRNFTMGNIEGAGYEYIGFLGDFGLQDQAVNLIHRHILDKLLKNGHINLKQTPQGPAYELPEPGKLVAGLSDLLDGYENDISKDGGTAFRVFHKQITVAQNLTPDERTLLQGLPVMELAKLTEHYIVYSTLKGLQTLMGPNILKYAPAPAKGLGSLERVNKLLALQL